jgi:hypothetical protein
MNKNKKNTTIFDIYRERANRISDLINKGYLDESVILIVTIFEVLLENVFKMNSKFWFYEKTSQYPSFSQFSNLSTNDKVKYREKIRKYLKTINRYDEYLRNFYIYQGIVTNPEVFSLYFTIFDKDTDKSIINFQNLTEKYGARKAYLIFYDIDISNFLDPDTQTSQKKWRLLVKLVNERHDIIHKGAKTTLTRQEILQILESIEYLKEHILMDMTSRIFTDIHKNVLDEISKTQTTDN